MESRSDTTELSLDELVRLQEIADADEPPTDGGDHGHGDHGDDDGAIVLPWWQHPVNIVTMLVTVALLAGMVGWMVGDAGGDLEYNDVDRGFLQDMREHHEQAVLMSFIYRTRPDTDPGLRTVARTIVVGQSLEVGRMIQLLRVFGEAEINTDEASMLWMGMSAAPGQMPGMATEAELEELGAATGRAADELFVELMTDHHLGGVEMAEFAAENAANDEVVAFAEGIVHGQLGEIAEMEGQLD